MRSSMVQPAHRSPALPCLCISVWSIHPSIPASTSADLILCTGGVQLLPLLVLQYENVIHIFRFNLWNFSRLATEQE